MPIGKALGKATRKAAKIMKKKRKVNDSASVVRVGEYKKTRRKKK